MQTKMTKLSTTLNAEVETGSEEKDTSEVVVSVAPGNFYFLLIFNDHQQNNRLVIKNNNYQQ